MATYSSIRDVLVKVYLRENTGGFLRRWTILSEEFHRDNVLLVTAALAKGLLKYDGGHGLRLTRRGKRAMGAPFYLLSKD